jgi:hypothetical protein
MTTGYISVEHKNRQKENWATKHPMGRYVQESSRSYSGHEQPKTGVNWDTRTLFVKANLYE